VRGQEAVARRYAKAVFALAKEQNRAEPVGRELDDAVGVFEENRDLREFLARPWTPPARKREMVAAVAVRLELSKLVRDFVVLLAMRGRVDHLREIGEAYAGLVDADRGRVRARVRTVVPLTAAERKALGARIRQAVGGAEVVIEEVVDKSLLGGFIAEVGSLVLDGSLDGQLARVRERLATA